MAASFRIVHEASNDLGYIGQLYRDGSSVWAVGGTHGKPTILSGTEKGPFTKRAPPPTNGLRDLVLSGDRIIVCGEQGGVYVSSGDAWKQKPLGTPVCLFTLLRDSKGDVWVGGERGVVRRSKDSGETWTPFPIGTDARVNVIAQIGSTIWFACHDGTIFRYRREKLERMKVDTTAPICSLVVTRTNALVLCGDRGTIWRSKDGVEWKRIEAPNNTVDYEAVRQLGDGTILLVGDQGTVLESNDDGQSFTPIESTLQGHLWCILDTSNGALIGGDRGLVAEIEIGGL